MLTLIGRIHTRRRQQFLRRRRVTLPSLFFSLSLSFLQSSFRANSLPFPPPPIVFILYGLPLLSCSDYSPNTDRIDRAFA